MNAFVKYDSISMFTSLQCNFLPNFMLNIHHCSKMAMGWLSFFGRNLRLLFWNTLRILVEGHVRFLAELA
jgi:hypothetical protein